MMEHARTSANTALLMISGSGVGGAEKRFARTFAHLHQLDPSYRLFINRGLLESLERHQLAPDAGVHVLPEPLGPLDSPLKRKLYLGIYPFLCHQLMRRLSMAVAHLIGSSVYYASSLVLDPRFRTVVSSYNVRIDDTVSSATRPIFDFVLRHADAIDALSDDIASRLLSSRYNRGSRLDGRIEVMPCSFADYAGLESAGEKRDAVVFLGRFTDFKRPLLLVEAMPKVLEAHPNTHFYLLGNGPLEGPIQDRLAELGVEDSATVQFTTEPASFLASSRIFVSLQKDNNYPSQSLLEAMACENAVVATDVGETWKLVDEHTGIRVPADAQALGLAIIELLDDPELTAGRGQRARARVIGEHTVERAAAHLRRLHLRVQS
ncbi:MAG: glycosyltransferase family 4 protein [Deltaproteobacteria bacterium]|nr:glycosyltransferase family 4 protein [Deltaproteobacteria bacterium]